MNAMNADEGIHFYCTFIANEARQLAVHEATLLLRGALSIGGDHEALQPLREAYLKLVSADAQLELIALSTASQSTNGKGNA